MRTVKVVPRPTALVAVTVAALTVYDMTKGMDKGIGIQQIVLERKTGGKSGDYRRPRRVEKKRSKK